MGDLLQFPVQWSHVEFNMGNKISEFKIKIFKKIELFIVSALDTISGVCS